MSEIAATLKKALKQLHAERNRIERQVTVLEGALASLGGRLASRARGARKAAGKALAKAKRARRRMSAAQKQAVSQRMKAYWAKRRKEAGK